MVVVVGISVMALLGNMWPWTPMGYRGYGIWNTTAADTPRYDISKALSKLKYPVPVQVAHGYLDITKPLQLPGLLALFLSCSSLSP
jgi:hypothetical protein